MTKLPNAQESKKQMQNLGFYLPVIRDGFKWSLEELGNRLDVSKQTIANIEKQARNNVENSVTNEEVQIEKDCMTYAQYFTLRTIIGNELEHMPKNDETKKRIEFVLCVLVDEDTSKLNEADRANLGKFTAATFLGAVTSKSAMASLLGLFPVLGIASPVAAIIGAVSAAVSTTALSWLNPWNKKDSKKK